MFNSLQLHRLVHAPLSSTIFQSLLRFMSIESVMLCNHLIFCHQPCPPALNICQHQGPFQWVGFSHQVAKVLVFQHRSFQSIFRVDFYKDWLVWSLCCPRDSQESPTTPQFKSIISSVLSLLYGPTLTMVYDYWENHSFDYMDLCCMSRYWDSFLDQTLFRFL